jgi:hypothetical protein
MTIRSTSLSLLWAIARRFVHIVWEWMEMDLLSPANRGRVKSKVFCSLVSVNTWESSLRHVGNPFCLLDIRLAIALMHSSDDTEDPISCRTGSTWRTVNECLRDG